METSTTAPSPILTWTNSSLTALLDCGECYRRRYLEREWRPSRAHFIRGRALDEMVTAAMLCKMQTGALPPAEEMLQTTADAFDVAWESEGVEILADDVEAWGSPEAVRGREKDTAIALAGLHYEQAAPAINPVGVQQRITVTPTDSDLVIEGTLDLVDGQPFGHRIRDTKSRQKSPSADEAHRSQQLTMYSLLDLAKTGVLPPEVQLDVLVRTPKRGDLKYVPLTSQRDATDLDALVDRLNVATEAVKRGVFLPASPDSWKCSESYCSYWSTCPYVRRGRRAA